jgi:phospholipase C
MSGGWHARFSTRANALDHVVVVLFENRSLDNILGHLYGPKDGKAFEGVIRKDLSNPIPQWAEHGADRKVVPYTVATDTDSPNPDSGEEWFHTNTQLFGTLDGGCPGPSGLRILIGSSPERMGSSAREIPEVHA